MSRIKRALFIAGGLVWFLFALGFGIVLVGYVRDGAGQQLWGLPVSAGSVLMGLVHVIGFGAAALISFTIGAGMCAQGIVDRRKRGR